MKAATKKRARAPLKASPPRALDSGATPLAFWSGDFGKEYTERNRVDWSLRVPLLRRMIEQTGATSFLDVGCNAGWNLCALRNINPGVEMSGVDVNDDALAQAADEGFDVVKMPASEVAEFFGSDSAQMVITSGVLIHVPPHELEATMRAIVDVSAQYVLCIEYDAPEEKMVEYRGHAHRLWKRPFGKLYEALGLSVLETGVAAGYVDCAYWLMERS